MDIATIEETNRLRVSMGMKPLPVPGQAPPPKSAEEEDEDPSATFEGRKAQAYDNYMKMQNDAAAKLKREKRLEEIKKARERAQRDKVLEGKGLGEADEGDSGLDAKAWLKGQKKRQKKIEKSEKEQAELAAAQAAAAKERGYTSKDLAGVKVGHEMSTLLDGDEQILTLKDAGVLGDEEEGDELENFELREKEKLDERLDLKKKKRAYDPNNFDDTAERSVLGQYDEEISGKKKKVFTLDAQGSIADIADILNGPSMEKKANGIVSLAALEDAPQSSDYLDISEIKVKKPKKKKAKSTRQRAMDDEDSLFPAEAPADILAGQMDIDDEPTTFTKKKRTIADEELIDDDDLQTNLAAQRREVLLKRKRTRPQDIARQVREYSADERDGQEAGQGTGLVIDETSEFLSSIKKDVDEEEKPRAKKIKTEDAITAMEDSDDEDVAMADTDAINKLASLDEEAAEVATTGVEDEKAVSEGLGATLALLKSRRVIQDNDGPDRVARDRHYSRFIMEKNRLYAEFDAEAKRQRERDRTSGLLDRMTQQQREEHARKINERREHQVSKLMNEMFKDNYEPKFEIKYTDDYGRSLDQKEAFKFMSHKFHGKGSGNMKTAKYLKKIEDEKRREAQPILDSSHSAGMSSAMAQQTKKRREAGVRLA